MLAPCLATCCVRECAPERGGARRCGLPFLASFGLSKFGLLQHTNDGWKVPSACAAIYARRGAVAESRVARIAARTSCNFFFFGCKTRDEKGRRKDGRRCTQTIVLVFGTKVGTDSDSAVS